MACYILELGTVFPRKKQHPKSLQEQENLLTEDKCPESTLCAAATHALDRRAQRPSDPRTAGPTGLSQRSAQQNKISLMTLGRKGGKGEENERGDREKGLAPPCVNKSRQGELSGNPPRHQPGLRPGSVLFEEDRALGPSPPPFQGV